LKPLLLTLCQFHVEVSHRPSVHRHRYADRCVRDDRHDGLSEHPWNHHRCADLGPTPSRSSRVRRNPVTIAVDITVLMTVFLLAPREHSEKGSFLGVCHTRQVLETIDHSSAASEWITCGGVRHRGRGVGTWKSPLSNLFDDDCAGYLDQIGARDLRPSFQRVRIYSSRSCIHRRCSLR
jgi:hypothetical protein